MLELKFGQSMLIDFELDLMSMEIHIRKNKRGNQETLTTLSTQTTGRRQTKQTNTTQKSKKMSNTE